MYRKFGIGDMVICKTSGVTGRVIKFYKPTACEEQTMVVTGDGRKYHAPTSEWIKIEETVQKKTKDVAAETVQKVLNPYGEYVLKFAENHNMSITEAYEQPMVRARYKFFCETGM